MTDRSDSRSGLSSNQFGCENGLWSEATLIAGGGVGSGPRTAAAPQQSVRLGLRPAVREESTEEIQA
jgi:hypothetical protein